MAILAAIIRIVIVEPEHRERFSSLSELKCEFRCSYAPSIPNKLTNFEK
jgi:hypothetical protein